MRTALPTVSTRASGRRPGILERHAPLQFALWRERPVDGRRRPRYLAFRQQAQHVGQDAAMAQIVHLDRRIDPNSQRDLPG